jgi:TrmH family RNA methyltransferase
MLSKANIKYLVSLQQKKIRLKEKAFLVEGEKIAEEVFRQDTFNVHSIYATQAWIDKNSTLASKYNATLTAINQVELKKVSSLKTPNQILIVLNLPNYTPLEENIQESLHLVLENIQDPGNMGTIIRIADWFGICTIFCSKGCVDVYNSKVVQASMGSFLRVKVRYTNLEELFEEHPELPVYGAVLGGNNAFQADLQQPSFLLIGNEGKGLSADIQKYITSKITIPRFGQAESLNAAVATGILCAFFQRSFTM